MDVPLALVPYPLILLLVSVALVLDLVKAVVLDKPSLLTALVKKVALTDWEYELVVVRITLYELVPSFTLSLLDPPPRLGGKWDI